MEKKIKVLIVDGSATFRLLLTKLLSSDPEIEVIGTAADPYIAANKMRANVPDVITLDINTPRMNGATFLKKIMAQHPVPVIIISTAEDLMVDGNRKTLIDYGAAAVLSKKMFESPNLKPDPKTIICDLVKSASQAKIRQRPEIVDFSVAPKLSADAIIQSKPKTLTPTKEKIIAVGASTGGTEAIRVFLEGLPKNCPGVVIVQHMPETFTRSFADRLNELCVIDVKEAANGDLVLPGRALIAPGNYHMMLKKRGTQYYVETNDGPLVNRHRPAVDVLFRSVAKYAGKNAIGIILTGMGDDGAKGLLEIKEAGGYTIAQDENTCVVFGMPKEAILLNAAERVLPLNEIANHVMNFTAALGYS